MRPAEPDATIDQHRKNPVEHRKRNLRYEHEEARRNGSASLLWWSATQAGAETLRVGSETVYPPFEFLDSNSGKYVGFDIDLIDEVAKRAGFEPQILSMGLDGLIPALMSGSIDVAVSRPHDYAGACRQGRLHEAVL